MAIDLCGEEYDKMVRLAQDVLSDYCCYSFPIDVYALAQKIGMNIIPYSSLTITKYERLIAKEGTEKGFTIAHIRKNGTVYDTYYNDVDIMPAACRFTIAHEIKHVVSGDCFKEQVSEADEQLADYFAKCLLAPQAVVIDENIQTPQVYSERFGLSNQVAVIWFITVEKRKRKYGANSLFDYEKEFIKKIGQSL